MAGEDAPAQHAPSVPEMPVLLLVALFSAGCASHLPPLNTSGQSFTPASDEALLWERARREQRKLSVSSGLLRDPVLEEYLTDVAYRLLPPGTLDAGVSPSIHVLINPSLNAFAYPTGALWHSGLLARLENEAQLATCWPTDRPHRASSCHPPSAAGTEQRSRSASQW